MKIEKLKKKKITKLLGKNSILNAANKNNLIPHFLYY